MQVRSHPRMVWQGRPNWPPEWVGPYGPDNPLPKGEVGTLGRVECVSSSPMGPHCSIVMNLNNQEYVGTLHFDEERFLETISHTLAAHIGQPLSEIGSLDIR
jgi:hypothetical protein